MRHSGLLRTGQPRSTLDGYSAARWGGLILQDGSHFIGHSAGQDVRLYGRQDARRYGTGQDQEAGLSRFRGLTRGASPQSVSRS